MVNLPIFTLKPTEVIPIFRIWAELGRSNYSDSCTNGSVAVGGPFGDRQVNSDDLDLEG